jgi:hypothetical protein
MRVAFILTGCVTHLALMAPAVAADGIAAVSVRDFLDSIGVCAHVGQGIDDPSRSAAALG